MAFLFNVLFETTEKAKHRKRILMAKTCYTHRGYKNGHPLRLFLSLSPKIPSLLAHAQQIVLVVVVVILIFVVCVVCCICSS